MAATRRAFNDLPEQLRTFLESEEEFRQMQSIFFIFLKKIKADLRNQTTIADAARAYVILEYIKSELETLTKTFSPVHQIYKTQTVPKLFEEMGIPALPIDEGFTVSVKPRLYCNIRPTAKEEAFNWLKENNLGDIIQPAVNPKTLVSAIQELIETQGIEPPKDYFNSFIQDQAKVTKGRASKKTIEKDEDIFDAFDELEDE